MKVWLTALVLACLIPAAASSSFAAGGCPQSAGSLQEFGHCLAPVPGTVSMVYKGTLANLDPAHQHDTLSLAREWAGSGACVVAILHDANLALRHADDAVVLHEGRVFAQGAAQETLTPALMETVFGVACTSVETAQGEPPFLAIRGRK